MGNFCKGLNSLIDTFAHIEATLKMFYSTLLCG